VIVIGVYVYIYTDIVIVYFMFQSACVLVYVLVTPVCLTEMIIKEATLYLLKFKGNVGVAQCDGTRLEFQTT